MSIMHNIDGSLGGGSILRVAIPVALAQQEDITISNIRHNRSNPGLRPQHLEGIRLICRLTNSELEGGTVGSKEITIRAGEDRRKEAKITIHTAGAVSLVYQLLSNYTMMSQSTVHVEFEGGGTHTRWSPNFDYLRQVTLPALQLFGQEGSVSVDRYGYYPKGGASGKLSIECCAAPGSVKLDVVEGVGPINIVSRATTQLLDAKVAERQIQGVLNQGIAINNQWNEYNDSDSTGSAITAWMTTDQMFRGFSRLGEKGKPAERVGRDLARDIVKFDEPSAVDEFLADQLILALSQARSQSYYTFPNLTTHVTTNINLINSMLGNTVSFQHHQDYYVLTKM